MGTLTPQQTAMLLHALLVIQHQVRDLATELDQVLTIFGSSPPVPPKAP